MIFFFVISIKQECLSQQQKGATKLGKRSFNKIGKRNAEIRPQYNEQQDMVLSARALLLPSPHPPPLPHPHLQSTGSNPQHNACGLNSLFFFSLFPLGVLVVCGVSLGETCM